MFRIGFERQHVLLNEGARALAEVLDLGRQGEIHGQACLLMREVELHHIRIAIAPPLADRADAYDPTRLSSRTARGAHLRARSELIRDPYVDGRRPAREEQRRIEAIAVICPAC